MTAYTNYGSIRVEFPQGGESETIYAWQLSSKLPGTGDLFVDGLGRICVCDDIRVEGRPNYDGTTHDDCLIIKARAFKTMQSVRDYLRSVELEREVQRRLEQE